MKTALVALLISCFGLSLFASLPALAADPVPGVDIDKGLQVIGVEGGYRKANETTVDGANLDRPSLYILINSAVLVLLQISGSLFLIMFIYYGVSYLIAGGNEDKVNTAKKGIFYTLIGLIIIMAAYSISYFVVSSTERAMEESVTQQ